MYTVADFGRMLGDRVRVDAHRAALARAVKPGAVVVDLGAGTGFFALDACRLGARKVYAIETNDAITLLPPLARKNGFADRIEILTRPSTEVTLPERADVVIADLRGVMPLFDANVSVIADARRRFLAPGGVLVPERDVLYVAAVESEALYDAAVGGWAGHGLDLSEGRTLSVNAYYDDRRHRIAPSQVVTAPAAWAEVRYGEDPPSLFEGSVAVPVLRDGTAHGLSVWFEAHLLADVTFTTAPGSDRVYGRGFFPLEEPMALREGDVLALHVAARRGGGDHVWAWSTTQLRQGAKVASFRQTSFLGAVTSARALAKEALDYRPAGGPAARATAWMLAHMDGEMTVEAIARGAHAAHPGGFASYEEALEEARRLSRTYG